MPGNFAGQAHTERPDVIGRRVMFGVQRHEYVGIGGADHARSAVHEIHLAVGQADVINDVSHFLLGYLPPDRVFDLVGQHGGIFDTGSGFGPEMEHELAAIRTREEIPTKPGKESRSEDAHQKKSRNENESSTYECPQ